jgi:hypothetical protein
MNIRFSPKRLLNGCVSAALVVAAALLPRETAQAFCGFYVSQGDTPLYNDASKVVLAWDDGRISITMASDYRGEPREFGLVIPVPVVVEKKDIRVVNMDLVDKLEAYSEPRLTEYTDDDPCPPVREGVFYESMTMEDSAPAAMAAGGSDYSPPKIWIEAQYQVGVYDIVILKAEESGDLIRYLNQNGYRIPTGASDVLHSYIAQGMHFFLAKVNLDRQGAAGEKFLRPIQVSYRSPKFMLPIRLGTVNAEGPQDLLVLALTRRGRVESVNYRTAKKPTGMDVPVYVRNDLKSLYSAAFDRKVQQDQMTNIYTEYAWSLDGYCDPCSAAKPDSTELYALGARWEYPSIDAGQPEPKQLSLVPETGFITRLHVRYDRAHFPEDLAFEETRDSEQFQVVYKIHHPWTGDTSCAAGSAYRRQLGQRFNSEAANLEALTGWKPEEIRTQMAKSGENPSQARRSFHQWLADQFH